MGSSGPRGEPGAPCTSNIFAGTAAVPARAGENEGTVWPQAKKRPSEAVARAGDHAQFTAAFGTGLAVDKVNWCVASREDALGHGEHALEALHPLDRSPGAAEHMDV